MYNKIDKKMEIIAIEKKTLDAMEEKFGQLYLPRFNNNRLVL